MAITLSITWTVLEYSDKDTFCNMYIGGEGSGWSNIDIGSVASIRF
jgi:hypothetical protein